MAQAALKIACEVEADNSARLTTEKRQNSEKAIDKHFLNDVIEGLGADKKSLSPKYFYDEKGSQFFDEICDLEEYYPYKTEMKLLPRVAKDIAERFLRPLSVVEFGAGSLIKIQPLLSAVNSVCEFIPIDISGEHLHQACANLQSQFPQVLMRPATGDFCHVVDLPKFRGSRLGFFPGSTIGNFTPDHAVDFLASAKQTLGHDAYMLIGVDTKKSPELLHRAYNDQKGVTAKFNLNVLERINRELNADIELDNFEHYAFYNANLGRIEMHLISSKSQQASINGNDIRFEAGESIHTECSYKYSPIEFKRLAERAGWQIESTWLADDDMFSMFLLRA